MGDQLDKAMPKLPCPPELWPEFSELLCAVLELPPGQRATWLNTLPPRYAPLRAGLARVVAHASELDGTPFLSAPQWPDSGLSEWCAGECVGPYILERERQGAARSSQSHPLLARSVGRTLP